MNIGDNERMHGMVLKEVGNRLEEMQFPIPRPKATEILLKVRACAVCRTDLHVIYGELKNPKLPLVPGHEIVGIVAEKGEAANEFALGERVGVPWLGWTCGTCKYCLRGMENLCDLARFTGYTLDGGYAEYAIADERFCFRMPEHYSNSAVAPLLCAGLIGYRSLKKTGDAEKIGIFGFGAAAHIIAQVATFQGRQIYAFTRARDRKAQQFALSLGVSWAGDSDQVPPEKLDAAIIFAPSGDLLPRALRVVEKGGTVVCGGIHMSDIPSFPYEILWEERNICSVANLTREDGREFFALASRIPIYTNVTEFPLSNANEALNELRSEKFHGVGVLIPAG